MGGILGADDPASDDDNGGGNAFESQEPVRIDDGGVVERDLGRDCQVPVHPDNPSLHFIKYPPDIADIPCPD
jgi:hypothetical protein